MTLRPLLYILFFNLLVFSSCKETEKRSENTYFGGTVKNKNSNTITLRDFKNTVIDTFNLDASGSFIHQFKNFEPGLYSFFDGRETQSVYIQKGDSLIFRINTIDFDESLTFTGTGSKENNFLINQFLENEKEEEIFLMLSQLPCKVFQSKIDSIRDEKFNRLKKFSSKNNTSDAFNELANATINFQNYFSKEFYPFARLDKDEIEVLSGLDPAFFDYRKDINYNNEKIQNYYPYKTFLRFHFNTLALQEQFKHSKDSTYNNTSLHYNLDRFKLVDQKISFQPIKNDISYYYMIRYLNDSKNVEEFDQVLSAFKKINNNADNIDKATKIINSYKRLKPGLQLPELVIVTKDDTEETLKSEITKPTVLYFWTINNKYHLIDAHKKAAELMQKYPEVKFIAINTDNISSKKQEAILQQNGLTVYNEFHFKNPEDAKDILAIKPINNVFLLDKNAKIINPKANMFSVDFEQQLVELLNL
jgi:hypothetical protein